MGRSERNIDENQFVTERALKIPKADFSTEQKAYLEESDEDEKISFIDLKRHIIAYHPHDNDERFNIYNDLGDYPGCCSEGSVRPMAKEIGLGPSLFLISTRKLMCFFFLIAVLNLPVYLFLWFSNDTKPITIGDILGKLSLGGIT